MSTKFGTTKFLDDLISAKQLAQEHPDTFRRPDSHELDALTSGDFVKVSRHHERFWIRLIRVTTTDLIGVVANVLVRPANKDLGPGLVSVHRDHVFAIQDKGGPTTDDELTNLVRVHPTDPAAGIT